MCAQVHTDPVSLTSCAGALWAIVRMCRLAHLDPVELPSCSGTRTHQAHEPEMRTWAEHVSPAPVLGEGQDGGCRGLPSCMALGKISEEVGTEPGPWIHEIFEARTLPFTAVPTKLNMTQWNSHLSTNNPVAK